MNYHPDLLAAERLRKNVVIAGHRTSIMLESAYWNGLTQICRREEIDLDSLIERIVEACQIGVSMSSAIRVVSVMYFQTLAADGEKALAVGSGHALDPNRKILPRVLAAYRAR